MEIDLDQAGNPISAFLAACAVRAIDLGTPDEPHPHQVIPARWRSINTALGTFVDELDAVEKRIKTDGAPVLAAYRHLAYEATELFDCYAALLPSRIQPADRHEKEALKEFKETSKRLRDFTAKFCNRCKHEGAQLKLLWATSHTNGRSGARLLVTVYRDGNSLVRDDLIHDKKMAGLGLVRLGHELAHALLRTDRAAGKLISRLSDREGVLPHAPSATLPIGDAIRRLAALRATRHDDETSRHDGITVLPGNLKLEKVEADSLGPHVKIQATLTVESGTTTYSFA